MSEKAPDQTEKPFIDVAAGLILRDDGSLLLAERPNDKPWAGWWELPGGKIEPGENTLQALARELKEELDIEVREATPWVTYVHEYPKTIVRLAFCRVTRWDGDPVGIEGQKLAWVRPCEAGGVGRLLPATEPPLRWIQLPQTYSITSIGSAASLQRYLTELTTALGNGLKLLQFREPAWMHESGEDVYAAFKHIVQLCHKHGARCLVNSCHPKSWWSHADGVHLRASDAHKWAADVRDSNVASGLADDSLDIVGEKRSWLLAVSAHTSDDLRAAARLEADFIVLGHVLDTPSHPNQPGMGWPHFASLASSAGRPVFAIGGQSAATLAEAMRHGAHGIAGIRHINA